MPDKSAKSSKPAASSESTATSAEVELRGHIIDSYILPRVWAAIMDAGGRYQVREMRIGQSPSETSYARLEVSADTPAALHDLLLLLEQLGAALAEEHDARTARVTQDGVLPDDFYSTTNLPTQVRVDGRWLDVAGIEMDVAVVIDRAGKSAHTSPMHEVRIGDEVVVGYEGIHVQQRQRPRTREEFSFMQNPVSSERVKARAIHEAAGEIREARARGGRVLFVLGPAVVHTAARESVAALIRRGYIQVIFGGNAIVAHDIEAAMFGTSLGIDLRTGEAVEHGHRNHLRAINAVRGAGSLAAAHAQGLLGDGIVAAALEHDVELVLAGSIRDDGPMPGVITDTMVAQGAMRQALHGVEVAVMIASMLHGIATGNLLPAAVRTIVVDISPAVVTKLSDRGTAHAVSLVTDAELFLSALAAELP